MSDLVQRAAAFARTAHKGQKRKNGTENYIEHPRRVAALVSAAGGTDEQVAAAWLHDVVEDCDVAEAALIDRFGYVVADIVMQLTDKYPPKPGTNRAERKRQEAAYFADFASSEAVLVKLCDMLDNSSDLDGLSSGFRDIWLAEKKDLLHLLVTSEEKRRPL